MRRAIATVCLSGTIEEKIRAIAGAGFEAVEIFENDLIASPLSPSAIADLARGEGLAIELYQPFRDIEAVPDGEFQQNLRRARAKFRVMEQLGTDLILVCSNVATARIDDDELAAAQLRELAEAASDHGMRIAYEALAWGTFVSDVEHADRIIRLADHPALGHCVDSFHMLSRGWDGSALDTIQPEKVFFCQIADATRLNMDVLSWSRHHRVFPGEGGWDLASFMSHLAGIGYDGTVSLEIFNDVFRQTPPKRTAIDAMRSMVWLEDQTARRLADVTTRTVRSVKIAFGELPPIAPPSDFGFAELHAPGGSKLETVLAQLGLNHDGRHRTKPVELWSHDDARIIINEREPGPLTISISAIGVEVTDPLTAAARARELRAVEVPRENEADEAVLHGFSAPDAREIFLGRRSNDWIGEFGDSAATRPPRAAGGIARIDHVNLAQPWQYFDEAVLFYESTLALTPQPSLDVASPNGLVRSQVMRNRDGSVRLALNVAPLLTETNAEHSTHEHVAFASTDIVATARASRERGLDVLPIPQNYYDDLAARFPLTDAQLEELRSLDLLYDRDGAGEFLQFYTARVGSVFFEVVERRSGYEGYGAANAPVRMAAQLEHDRRH